jgi:heme exporter protein A
MNAAFDSVEARGVTKLYGATTALRNVSLTARAGAITCIEGENGSGKSTLLSILAGFTRPSRGEVRFVGPAAASGRTAQLLRRHAGVVSHAAFLYPDLTGRENLELFASLYGVLDPAGSVARAGERFAVLPFWDRAVRTYSRGQTQRVSIARALLHDPALVLFDEPTTGLDGQSVLVLENVLTESRAAGKIVVLVTHDGAWANRFADARVRLVRGQVEGERAPSP